MEVPLSHADDCTKDSPESELRPESQGTASKENVLRKNGDRHLVSHCVPQGQPTLAHLHHDNMLPMAPVLQQVPEWRFSQHNGHSHVQHREPEDSVRTDQQHTHYVNQSRVQAMTEDSKAHRNQSQVSPESPSLAPMPDEPHFDLPPPFITYFEELTSTSHDPAAAMNQGSPYHVQSNVQWRGIQGSVQERVEYGTGGGEGHDESWKDGGGGGDGEGRDGYGGGEHARGAQLGIEQQRGLKEGCLGGHHEPTNLLSTSSQAAPYEHQLSTKSPEHNPQEHVPYKKHKYPVHVARDSADKTGTENPVTGLQARIGPNLTCAICGRVFQRGEIQLYRKHVGSCENSEM